MGLTEWFRRYFNDDIPQNPQNPHVPLPPVAVQPYNPNKPTYGPLDAKAATLSAVLKAASSPNFTGKRIGIIVGHEEKRPGAVLQFGAMKGVPEYEYNTVIARLLQREITTAGGKSSIHFRDNIGIRGAYLQADKLNCDFIIELHFNSSADERASGVETLISTSNPYSDVSKLEMRFAVAFANEIHAIGGNVIGRKRGGNGALQVRKEDRGGQNVHVLQNTPTALIEPFFGSNAASCEIFGNLRGQQEIAEAIFSALAATFNI